MRICSSLHLFHCVCAYACVCVCVDEAIYYRWGKNVTRKFVCEKLLLNKSFLLLFACHRTMVLSLHTNTQFATAKDICVLAERSTKTFLPPSFRTPFSVAFPIRRRLQDPHPKQVLHTAPSIGGRPSPRRRAKRTCRSQKLVNFCKSINFSCCLTQTPPANPFAELSMLICGASAKEQAVAALLANIVDRLVCTNLNFIYLQFA